MQSQTIKATLLTTAKRGGKLLPAGTEVEVSPSEMLAAPHLYRSLADVERDVKMAAEKEVEAKDAAKRHHSLKQQFIAERLKIQESQEQYTGRAAEMAVKTAAATRAKASKG